MHKAPLRVSHRGKEAVYATRKPAASSSGVSADPTRYIAAGVWKGLALVTSTVLLSPFVGACSRIFACMPLPSPAEVAANPERGSFLAQALGGEEACFTGSHLALVVASVLTIMGLIGIVVVYWMLLIPRALHDPLPFAAVTGSRTVASVVEDAAVPAFIVNLLVDVLPVEVTVGISVALQALMFFPMVLNSQSLSFITQDFHTARYFAITWPIFCALLGTLFPDAEIGPLVLFGLPIVALGGFFISQARRAAILAAPLDKVTSEGDIATWAQYRFLIATRRGAGLAYWGLAMLDASGALQADAKASTANRRRRVSRTAPAPRRSRAGTNTSSSIGPGRSRMSSNPGDSAPLLPGGGRSRGESSSFPGQHHASSVLSGAGPASALGAGWEEEGDDDWEGHLALGGSALQADKLDEAAGGWLGSAAYYRANALTSAPRRKAFLLEAEQGYTVLLAKYPASYVGALRAAMFYASRHVRSSAYMELRLLAQAWRVSETGAGSAALDVSIHVIHRRLYLQHTGSVASSAVVSGARRLLFERHMAGARAAEVAGFRVAAAVWTELARTPPDLGALHALAIAFRKHRTGAEYHFRRMLVLNGNSPEVHRAFANFLLAQLHDEEEAAEHLDKARKLDEIVHASAHAKVSLFKLLEAPSAEGSSMDTGMSMTLTASSGTNMDDSVGVLLVSGGQVDAGSILDANAAACRVFGAARSDLVGTTITRLLPPPLGLLSRDAVHKFASRVDSLLYTWAHLLVVKLSGELVPVSVMLQEAPPAVGGAPDPRFAVLVRPLIMSGSTALAVVAITGDGGAKDSAQLLASTRVALDESLDRSIGGGGDESPAHRPMQAPTGALSGRGGRPPDVWFFGGSPGPGAGGARSRIDSTAAASPRGQDPTWFFGGKGGASMTTPSPQHQGKGDARAGASPAPASAGSTTWISATASMHALLGTEAAAMTSMQQHVQVWIPHIARKLRHKTLRRAATSFGRHLLKSLGSGYVEHEHLHGGFMDMREGEEATGASAAGRSFVVAGSKVRLRSAELVRLLLSTGAGPTDEVTDMALSDDVRVTVQAMPALAPDGSVVDLRANHRASRTASGSAAGLGSDTTYAIVTVTSLSGGAVQSVGGYSLQAGGGRSSTDDSRIMSFDPDQDGSPRGHTHSSSGSVPTSPSGRFRSSSPQGSEGRLTSDALRAADAKDGEERSAAGGIASGSAARVRTDSLVSEGGVSADHHGGGGEGDTGPKPPMHSRRGAPRAPPRPKPPGPPPRASDVPGSAPVPSPAPAASKPLLLPRQAETTPVSIGQDAKPAPAASTATSAGVRRTSSASGTATGARGVGSRSRQGLSLAPPPVRTTFPSKGRTITPTGAASVGSRAAGSVASSSVWSNASGDSAALRRVTVKSLQSRTRLLRQVLDGQTGSDLVPVRLTQRIFIVWTILLLLFCIVGGVSYWLSFQDLMVKHAESLWRAGERMRYLLEARQLIVSAGFFTGLGVNSTVFAHYMGDLGAVRTYLNDLDESQLLDARELIDFRPRPGSQDTAFTRPGTVHLVSGVTLEARQVRDFDSLYREWVRGDVGEVSAGGPGVRINSPTLAQESSSGGLSGGAALDAEALAALENLATAPNSVTQAAQYVQLELGFVADNASLRWEDLLLDGSSPRTTALAFNVETTILEAYNDTQLAKGTDAAAYFDYMWLQDITVLLVAMLLPALFMLARSSFTAAALQQLRFEPLATMLFLPQEHVKVLAAAALDAYRAALGREDTSEGTAAVSAGNGKEDKSAKRQTPLAASNKHRKTWSREDGLAGARYHTDMSSFLTCSFLVISTPLLAIVLYISIMFALDANLLRNLSQESQRMYTVQQLALHSSKFQVAVSDALATTGIARETAIAIARREADLNEYYFSTLLHGGCVGLFERPTGNAVLDGCIPVLPPGSTAHTLLTKEACQGAQALAAGASQDTSALGSIGALAALHAEHCRTTHHRLLARGLQQGVFRYLSEGSGILGTLDGLAINATAADLLNSTSPTTNSSWWSPAQAEVFQADLREWVSLEEQHLRHALGRLSVAVYRSSVTALVDMRAAFQIANIVAAVLIPVAIAFLLWPLVSYLGESLLAARGLLLLVSPHTVHEVPELKRLVVSLLREYTTARKFTKWWKDHDVAVGRNVQHARNSRFRAGAVSSAALYTDGVYNATDQTS